MSQHIELGSIYRCASVTCPGSQDLDTGGPNRELHELQQMITLEGEISKLKMSKDHWLRVCRVDTTITDFGLVFYALHKL